MEEEEQSVDGRKVTPRRSTELTKLLGEVLRTCLYPPLLDERGILADPLSVMLCCSICV
jgi:hypothetical protein